MIALLIALTVGQIQVLQNGASKGSASVVNCGTNVTCAVVGGRWTLSATGGGGIVIPVCVAGQVVTANGAVLSCTNTITNATNATTATTATTASALAANPADCAANTYATTIAANGDLTCSTVSDTGLANAYSGVGACGAHTWVSTEARNAVPTCTQPAYSDLSGCVPASGASTLQYDNAGCLGSVANVISDGTHDIFIPEAMPATPTGGSMEFDLNSLQTGAPMRRDVFMALPIPLGLFRTSTYSQIGTAANWYVCINYPSQWNSTTVDVAIGCLTSNFAAEGTAASGGGWGTSFTSRNRRVGLSTLVGQNWVGVHRGNLDDGEWVGNASGVGGFIMFTRFWGVTHQTGDMTFAGVAATASAFTNGSKPSQQLNTAYVGCDATDTNLQVCSNDGVTTSCVTTSASFPCRTNATIYDVWLAMPPNAKLPDAGTGFGYYIERLDSAASISGVKTANMPTNNIQLTPHAVLGSPDGGTLTTKMEFSSLSTWSNL